MMVYLPDLYENHFLRRRPLPVPREGRVPSTDLISSLLNRRTPPLKDPTPILRPFSRFLERC